MTDFLKHMLTRGMALLLVVVLTLTLIPYSTAIAKDKRSDGPVRVEGDNDGIGGFKYRFEESVGGGERDTYWGEPESGGSTEPERITLKLIWLEYAFTLLRR